MPSRVIFLVCSAKPCSAEISGMQCAQFSCRSICGIYISAKVVDVMS